jgi:hypothetical protein
MRMRKRNKAREGNDENVIGRRKGKEIGWKRERRGERKGKGEREDKN